VRSEQFSCLRLTVFATIETQGNVQAITYH